MVGLAQGSVQDQGGACKGWGAAAYPTIHEFCIRVFLGLSRIAI
jgi:hypothetical protein